MSLRAIGPFLSRCGSIAFALTLFVFAASSTFAADTYRIVRAYPHDEQAFTQGLIYLDGHIYESTGIKGRSSLREEDLETGRILKFQAVPGRYFGEGLTNWGNELIQLTWTSHTALVYDLSTFRLSELSIIHGRVGASPRTAKTSSSATAPPPCTFSIRHLQRSPPHRGYRSRQSRHRIE